MTESPPRKKYARVGQMIIRPLMLHQGVSAYDLARLFYKQFNDLDFDADLQEYMRNGFVITRPHMFAMLRPIEHEGERIWYIRIIVGNLAEAISCMPCWLPKVAFSRNNNPEMVVVDTKRAIEISLRKAANGTNGWKS